MNGPGLLIFRTPREFHVASFQPPEDRIRGILNGWESSVPFHFIVRFEPRPGREDAFRAELLRVNGPSREEAGCVSIEVFETLREPIVFAIHSEWVDEAAFDLHATLPHTVRFIEAAETLLTHSVEGLRLRQIGGGSGAGR